MQILLYFYLSNILNAGLLLVTEYFWTVFLLLLLTTSTLKKLEEVAFQMKPHSCILASVLLLWAYPCVYDRKENIIEKHHLHHRYALNVCSHFENILTKTGFSHPPEVVLGRTHFMATIYRRNYHSNYFNVHDGHVSDVLQKNPCVMLSFFKVFSLRGFCPNCLSLAVM